MRFTLALFVSAAVALVGCGSEDDQQREGLAGFQEIYDQGLTRYVDQFDPIETVEKQDGANTYNFAVPEDPAAEPRGPLCLRGAGFNVQTREGSDDALVVFLQGGGACWDTFCSASTEPGDLPGPGSNGGILDPLFPDNPVADWDVVFVPYCDGSVFAGDVDRELPGSFLGEGDEAGPGYQRGLQNLTAALDVALEVFPNPSRVLLTGVSAGGFGTITALPLVRYYYPSVEIILFNDSGVGVADGDDPSFANETLIDGWNARGIVPESCADCTADGHLTGLIEWQLNADPDVTMSALSYSEDGVVADFFVQVGADAFREQLLEETGKLVEAFPDRYRRFIPAGSAHTALLTPSPMSFSGFEIGGLDETLGSTTVLEFLTAQIDGTDAWVNLVDESLITAE